MKNIHVLPTDKPSRLSILNSGKLNFGAEIMSSSNSKPQHIYITSDKEIKKGDWFLDRFGRFKNNTSLVITDKKIILTTDQDLIKDGVQEIDDEFLEWFVKNPSCEFIEVQKWASLAECGYSYHITIPQEEPKQTDENGKPITYWGGLAEPKLQTLEEAADTYAKKQYGNSCGAREERKISKEDFIAGANWQAERMYSEEKPDYEKIKQALVEMKKVPMTFVPDERMYSEEEVIKLLDKLHKSPHALMDIDVEQWFEQFKNK